MSEQNKVIKCSDAVTNDDSKTINPGVSVGLPLEATPPHIPGREIVRKIFYNLLDKKKHLRSFSEIIIKTNFSRATYDKIFKELSQIEKKDERKRALVQLLVFYEMYHNIKYSTNPQQMKKERGRIKEVCS